MDDLNVYIEKTFLDDDNKYNYNVYLSDENGSVLIGQIQTVSKIFIKYWTLKIKNTIT